MNIIVIPYQLIEAKLGTVRVANSLVAADPSAAGGSLRMTFPSPAMLNYFHSTCGREGWL
jgi:hypothetical protein